MAIPVEQGIDRTLRDRYSQRMAKDSKYFTGKEMEQLLTSEDPRHRSVEDMKWRMTWIGMAIFTILLLVAQSFFAD